MEIKAKVLDLLQRAICEEQSFMEGLSEDQRAENGTLQRWSAKDVIAHIAAWKKRLVEQVSRAIGGETPSWPEDIDQANAEVYALNRERSWLEALEELRAADRAVLDLAGSMSEDQMVDTGLNPWHDNRPTWVTIVGNSFTHPILHVAQYYAEHGEGERALGLQESTMEPLMKIDSTPTWRGNAIYNLACAYATAGDKKKALDHLREALRLNPDLSEWSRQDPDFNPLREDPDYLAIYSAS